jgi:hypothetical protein
MKNNVMTKVVVKGYTYETNLPVKVGDTVVLPTPHWLRDVKGPTWEGIVSKIGSDYQGVCEKIISVK